MDTLQLVLDDVSQQPSSDAYTTFFKHIAFAPFVHDILSNITTGAPFPPGPHAIKDASHERFGAPTPPQFVCITEYNQISWSFEAGGQGGRQVDAHSICQSNPLPAFSIFGSEHLENPIILCPSFFSYPSISLASQTNCLVVDPHFNRFQETGSRMTHYQLWVLLNELAHGYIYAATGALTDVKTANDCASLAASDAATSAMNYVYYAASELFFTPLAQVPSVAYQLQRYIRLAGLTHLSIDVRLGCTSFPRVNSRGYSGTAPSPQGSVELLEIDANTTLSGGSESANMFTNEGQSAGTRSTGNKWVYPNGITLTPWPA